MQGMVRPRRSHLGPLQKKVETNAFWATDRKVARERVAALDGAGMERLAVSAGLPGQHLQQKPITELADDNCSRSLL